MPRLSIPPALRVPMLLAAVLAALALVAVGGVLAIGRETVWERAFGPPDLGPYDFGKLTRTGKLNDALACPLGACLGADPTLSVPVFAVKPAVLFAAIRTAVTADPANRLVEDDPARGRLRAVMRTAVFRFPDTLSVEVVSPSPGTATFAAYSRSQIGHADLGANAARLRSLVEALRRALPDAG